MNISILITTYNASSYIIETLESIINQTYMYYEIVIVDDGSTDKTIELINNFIRKNKLKNINLISHAHIGRAPALVLAVENAKYEWVAILDADDLWAENKLELQSAAIKEHQLSCLFTDCVTFNSKEDIYKISMDKISSLKKISLNSILISRSVCHSSVLMKKELATYDHSLKKQIDLDLWLQLLSRDNDLHLLSLPLSYHRVHENQSFESQKKFAYIMNSTKVRYGYALKNHRYCIAVIVWLRPLRYFIKNLKPNFINKS